MKQDIKDVIEETALDKRGFYQEYSQEEETRRIAYHYENEPEFFLLLTGGEWNCYSCGILEEGCTLTESQEKKLDKFAEMMNLQPGQHILDVGFGWGGPLVYLCHKYGVTGHGITISPKAVPVAEARAKKYGVNAKFEVIHWQDLPDLEAYDAVYSDEVLVHIENLDGFFAKCRKMLKPGGRMVHKELHLTHSEYGNLEDRLSHYINKVFGYTGNYRVLHEELSLADKNNFSLNSLYEIPIEIYKKVIDSYWLKNMHKNKKRLIELTGKEHYQDIRIYLKGILFAFNEDVYGIHIVGYSKI